jgi:arsenate reductase (thioredoxin)
MKYNSILFLCVANSARSQMAEAWARHMYGDAITVQSAGSQPSQVNPYAIHVMKEAGVSMDGQCSTSVEDVDAAAVDLVITLCAEEVCPTLLAQAEHLHWPIPDPDQKDPQMPANQQLEHFRTARHRIYKRLIEFDFLG